MKYIDTDIFDGETIRFLRAFTGNFTGVDGDILWDITNQR